MAKLLANILTGHVDLYIKAYAGTSGDPEADNPISNDGAGNVVNWAGWGLAADGLPIGFQSEDGLDFEYEAEWLDIMVAAHNAPVRRDLIGESLTVKITLQESSLAQLQYAMAGATYTAAAVAGTNANLLSLGDKAVIGQWAIGFQGIATTGQALVGFIRKVDSIAAVAIKFRKGEVRGIPLEFGSLADPNLAAGSTLAMLYELTEEVLGTTTLDSPGIAFDDVDPIEVASTTSFTTTGWAQIDDEIVSYTKTDEDTFVFTRAVVGTAVAHTAGAVVTEVVDPT